MGQFCSSNPIILTTISTNAILKLDNDKILYMPNNLLYFNKDIKKECFDVLTDATLNNKIVKIWHDKLTIYAIGTTCDSIEYVAKGLVPTSFGFQFDS